MQFLVTIISVNYLSLKRNQLNFPFLFVQPTENVKESKLIYWFSFKTNFGNTYYWLCYIKAKLQSNLRNSDKIVKYMKTSL